MSLVLGVKMCCEHILSSCYVKKVNLEVVFQVFLACRKKNSVRRKQVKQQKSANKINTWVKMKFYCFSLQTLLNQRSLQNGDVAFEIISLKCYTEPQYRRIVIFYFRNKYSNKSSKEKRLVYRKSHTKVFNRKAELEFLKSLWGLGTEEE
jgi:hypothetical protein